MYSKKTENIFNKLKEAGIIESKGSIFLNLLGIKVKINDKSSTGNLIQEWLGSWMDNNEIYNRVQDIIGVRPPISKIFVV